VVAGGGSWAALSDRLLAVGNAVWASALAAAPSAAAVSAAVVSAGAGGSSGSVAIAPAWPLPGVPALAARGRVPDRGWPTEPAGDLLAARLEAEPVPAPAEFSPGTPFSAVTAP